jgi:hypothetical protein
MKVSALRERPARMLLVFGTPTAFLLTRLLHMVAAGDHSLYTAVSD